MGRGKQYRRKVLDIVSSLNIASIDTKMFFDGENLHDLYSVPYGASYRGQHYSPKGYEIVAREIQNFIAEREIKNN